MLLWSRTASKTARGERGSVQVKVESFCLTGVHNFPSDWPASRLYCIPKNNLINHIYCMLRERTLPDSLSEFLRYLAQHGDTNGQQLPALNDLSRELGVSIASLREQLEVARALGLVEVRPRTAQVRQPYPAVQKVRIRNS
jgi:hypothetical protein